MMFKNTVRYLKVGLGLDLRRKRRAVLDSFMVRVINLENFIVKMYHPENKSLAEIEYKLVRSISSFREAVWSSYSKKWGASDIEDWRNENIDRLMEDAVNAAHSIGTFMNFEDDDPMCGGTGNFPKNGVFGQGED